MQVLEDFCGGDKMVGAFQGFGVGMIDGVVQAHGMAGFFHHDRQGGPRSAAVIKAVTMSGELRQ